MTSLQARNPYVLQGGDVVFRLLVFWSLFLPLGAMWSVDRALSDSGGGKAPPKRVFSAGTIAFIAQILIVYWYGVAMKTGAEWKDGTAVYYALSLDQFATPFAKALLEYPELMKILTRTTYWFEIIGPALAIIPIFPQWFRLAGVMGMIGMHIGFGAGLELGLFPWISCAGWLAFLPPLFWDRVAVRLLNWRERVVGGRLTIAYDGGCSFCRRGVHLLRTWLILPNSIVIKGQDDPGYGDIMDVENSWVVGPNEGEKQTAWKAGALLVRASPWLFWLAPLARAFGGVGTWIYRLVEKNRMRFGRWSRFLLAEKPIRWRLGIVSQVIAAGLILYVFAWNNGKIKGDDVTIGVGWASITIPVKKLQPSQKKLGYMLRLDQNWNMFAPRPMRGDGWFVIVGTTRQKDVINLFGDKPQWEKPAWVKDIYKNQRWRKYLMNLWMAAFKRHRRHYGRYVCRNWDRDNKANRLDVFHIMYMKEQTTPDGTAPLECVSLWQHWCNGKGKTVEVKPYEDHCDRLNVRHAIQVAAKKACTCPDSKKPQTCLRISRKHYGKYEKKLAAAGPIGESLQTEISTAVTAYEGCVVETTSAAGAQDQSL
ncbi:MAG: hypothetical protein ACI9OJ_003835 [Myxococcota bacterium]